MDKETSVSPTDEAIPDGAQSADKSETASKKRSLGRRLLKTALFLLYALVLLEVGSRVYWVIKRDMPFFCTQQHFYDRFYEELDESGVRQAELTDNDGTFDVLMLGGSAMDRNCRYLAQDTNKMTKAFGAFSDRPVRIFNVAAPALTTRDSVIKYELLGRLNKHFDLVVIYHGINDLRMNNIAPDRFRDDYKHSGWYRQIDRMQAYGSTLSVLTLPYTVEYTVLHILSSKKLDVFIPRHRLNADWMQYGEDIKTAGPFRTNLDRLCDIARDRNEPVAIMTFAWHIPENYTVEDLRANKLDYAGKIHDAVENWGSVAAVRKGMATHNEIIRQLAADRPDVIFIDTDATIEKDGTLFNDVCHFSDKGKRAWLTALAPALAAKFAPTDE